LILPSRCGCFENEMYCKSSDWRLQRPWVLPVKSPKVFGF
jgi:hypothetical protein